MTVLTGDLITVAELLLRRSLLGYGSAPTRAAYRRDLQHWLGSLTASAWTR